MKIKFTPAALQQFEGALDRIARSSPQGAANVRARAVDVLTLLAQFPQIGRETSRRGVRRIAVVPYPYVLDFRVTAVEVVILGFRHAARRPLP